MFYLLREAAVHIRGVGISRKDEGERGQPHEEANQLQQVVAEPVVDVLHELSDAGPQTWVLGRLRLLVDGHGCRARIGGQSRRPLVRHSSGSHAKRFSRNQSLAQFKVQNNGSPDAW